MVLDGLTLWSYVSLVIVGVTCYYLKNWFRAVILAFQIPAGPPAVPIIGNIALIVDHQKLVELGKYAYKEYGPVFRVWLTVIPTAVLLSPEHIQIVLSSNKNTEKLYFYSLLHNFLGQGLITSSGEKWRYHRRIIQPSFHLNVLEGFISTFFESAKLMVEQLHARTDLKEVNITSPINECVFNILHEAVLGIPLNSDVASKERSPFRKGKVVAPYRMVRPWLLLNWIYKHTDISKEELQQQQNLFQFTTKVVQEERHGIWKIILLIKKGQDSVGAGLAFTLFELARHPEIQERVVEEIKSVFGDDTRTPTMNDLRELKYLEQCIKESLRLYPSVPIVLRTLTEDAKLGKIILPAGCAVVVSPFATHRLPHVYPDPERFNPDRFLPNQVEKRHPYSFLPFSAGPRNCIGHKFALMEMKTVISTILRNFSMTTVPGRDTLKLKYRITMRASGGIWLHLTPRV